MSSRAAKKAQAREARLAAQRAAERRRTRRHRLATLAGVLAAAAAVLVVAILVSRSGTEDVPPAGERLAMFDGIAQDGTKLGSDDAPVVVEEYVDLQCPFCAAFAATGLPPIVQDHVRTGEVQLDLEVLTFLGPDSVEAGQFAAAAGLQDRQWQFVEAFFEQQGREGSGYVDEDFLRDVAAAVPGLDADRAFADAAGAAAAAALQAAQRSAREGDVASTPTFRVGRRGGELRTVTGDELPQAIAEALDAT